MKTKIPVLLSSFLLIHVAMGASALLKGPTTCKQDSTYTYTVTVSRDNVDKKKGKLKEKEYEWFLLGFADVRGPKDSDTAYVKTVPVDVFPDDPQAWPTGSAQCTVRIVWSNSEHEEQCSSNLIKHTVAPQKKP